MSPQHEQLTLAEGLLQVQVPVRDLWLGVTSLGGDLSQFEIEAYVLGALEPDSYSHNLIAQALNEESLASGDDHPVGYAKGDEFMTEQTDVDADTLRFDGAFADVDPQVWSNLDRLGRALHVERGDVQATLDAILRLACQVVSRADAAGLNLLVKGSFQPQAVLGQAPHELDRVQQASGVGPCVDASREQRTVEAYDMRDEGRWPEFAARAVELGVLSMLCVPLWVDEARLGSISLYSSDVDAFDEQARSLAGLFGTHAALALADAQLVANLRQALTNRDVIGQAKGILMASQRITADQAFALLSAASQSLNVKLARVAEAVSTTGELPTL